MGNRLPKIEDLNDALQHEKKEEKNDLDVLKELFNEINIKTKTELTSDQIILVNQKRSIAKLIGFEKLNFVLNDFMALMVSRNRAGRGEFIDGFKSNREHEQQQGQGFFQDMKNKFQNR